MNEFGNDTHMVQVIIMTDARGVPYWCTYYICLAMRDGKKDVFEVARNRINANTCFPAFQPCTNFSLIMDTIDSC